MAAEAATFAGLLHRDVRGDAELRRSFAILFAALAVAGLVGGLVHGFFPDRTSSGHALLWPLTLLALGAAGFAAWLAAGRLLLAEHGLRRLRLLAALQLAGIAGLAFFVTQDFRLGIAAYLPAALFLLVAFARGPEARHHWGALGLLASLAAAALQQLRVGVHPVHFDHNALYHSVQAVGLAGIFVGARAAIRARAEQSPC